MRDSSHRMIGGVRTLKNMKPAHPASTRALAIQRRSAPRLRRAEGVEATRAIGVPDARRKGDPQPLEVKKA